MLRELKASNFKSWETLPLTELAPITGFFGPNSSGKTSILQLLLLMKQTVESSDRAQVLNLGDERSLASLGSFRDVLFRHESTRRLELSFKWGGDEPLRVVSPEHEDVVLFEGETLGFEVAIIEDASGSMKVERFSYEIAGRRFTMSAKSGPSSGYTLHAETPDSFKFSRARGRPWDLPPPIKSYGFPDQVKAYFQNAGFLADLQLRLEDLFNGTYYLGPLRDFPRRQYTWGGGQPEDVGQRGERVVDALLASRMRKKTISRGKGRKRISLEECAAMWLHSLGLVADFTVRQVAKGSNLYQVWVRTSADAPEVLITDVGFGVSQILPVVVLCYYVPPGSLLILEQPEIHLHPSVQAGLADVFIDAVKTRNIQIVFESHSEHLLQRLQLRIAEEQLESKQAALFFCNKETEGTSVKPLELDEYGNIINWPSDFFGSPLRDSVAMLEHEAARRARASA